MDAKAETGTVAQAAGQESGALGWNPEPLSAPKSEALRRELDRYDRYGEKAIALAQAAISCFILLLHLMAQIAHNWQSLNLLVVGALGALIATSALRWGLAGREQFPERTYVFLTVIDISIFLALIWTYQFAYNHPAGGVLKAPSFALVFVMVALRALRIHPRPVTVAGVTAIAGWCLIVVAAVRYDGADLITNSYPVYLTSHAILIGAEVEKTVALAALTALLAFATYKGRAVLSRSAHVADYSQALDAAQRNLEEASRARQKAESALEQLDLRDAELINQVERFNVAIENMSQGLCMFDADKNLVVCNSKYIEMYGLDPRLARPGTPFREIIEHRIRTGIYAGDDPESYIQERLDAIDEGVPSTKIHHLTNGHVVAIVHQPMSNGGWVATHEDITELERVQAKVAHMAHHDALTDLPNRLLLRERIDEALSDVSRGKPFAILCLDVDRFKAVNDTLGHPVGDELLKAITERLRACVREDDTIARLGGDEFAIVQISPDQPMDATALASRICDVIRKPFELNGHQVMVETSIGIAVAPGDGDDPDQLLKNADMALYGAKNDGRGVFRFFEPEMDSRMKTRRELELDLRKGLELGQFEVFYQPLVNLKTQKVSGLEALLRWRHPERGLISPGDFIPVAEEIGLIVPLGEWVIRQACTEAAKWPDYMKVAVNLSPVQFKSGNLVPVVMNALSASGMAPDRLELEITESVLLQDSAATLETLHQLRKLGVRIAMDDFGTGYSSLSYLRSFPFDKIKIDRTFINGLSDSDDAVAIIRAVASLGTSLGMVTTAEGVETEEQLKRVCKEGYTEIQGYVFSPPRPAEEIARMFMPQPDKAQTAASA